MKTQSKVQFLIFIAIATAALMLGNSTSMTSGHTGAPGETLCSSCHIRPATNNTGVLFLENFPQEPIGGMAYELVVGAYRTNDGSQNAGFQMTVLDNQNNFVGSFSDPGSQVEFMTSGNRSYAQHSSLKFFTGVPPDTIRYNFTWVAPEVSQPTNITFYSTVVLGTGSAGNHGVLADTTLNLQWNAQILPSLQCGVETENNSCYSDANGTAQILQSGGIPPYAVSWSTGESSSQIQNLSAGTYQVTLSDQSGQMCVQEFTISEPPALETDIEIVQPSVIMGNDGMLSAFVSGGTPPYSYMWNNGITDPFIDGLIANFYTLTVTDANGCSMNLRILLEDPSCTFEVIRTTVVHVSCFGGSDGFISIGYSGGEDPLIFSWNNGLEGNEIENLPVGLYQCVVIDLFQCKDTITVEITQPAQIEIPIINIVEPDEGGGGSILVEASGGVEPYEYEWSGPNGFTASTSEITDLQAGTYTLVITDANDCEKEFVIILNTISTWENEEEENQVRIMPNPFYDSFVIEPMERFNCNKFQILDMKGKILKSQTLDTGFYSIHVDNLANLGPGIYILAISNDQKTIFTKIQKL